MFNATLSTNGRRTLRNRSATALALGLMMCLALPNGAARASGESELAAEEAYPGRRGPQISVTLQTGEVRQTFSAMLIEGELVAEGDLVLGTTADRWDAIDADGRVLSSGSLDEILDSTSETETTFESEGSELDDLASSTIFGDRITGLVRKSKDFYWSDGVVPYTIEGEFSEASLERINDAIVHWREQTRIQLVPRSSQEDYIAIVPVDSGCSSSVLGRAGGRQLIRLSASCSFGSTVHEIGHAVGLFHEHTRPDRDNFVRVFWNNIEEGRENNFRRIDNERAVGAYDFGSIMHYGPTFFSVNGEPTLARIDGMPLTVQRNALSEGDIQAVQTMYNIEPLIEAGDATGQALAEGDFNGDGFADLAAGAPGEDLHSNGSSITDGGMVQVLYGRSGGLEPNTSQILHQDSPGALGVVEAYDRFGSVLAAGDLNGDGYDDLVVGVPGEDLLTRTGNIIDAGVAQVFYGGAEGLSALGNQIWNQDTPGIEGHLESYDRFGNALAIGDLNGDGYDDLAVGVAGEDLLKRRVNMLNCGVVLVIYGRPQGLTATGSQQWHQDSVGVLGVVEAQDGFGTRLAAGDLNGDGYDELVVGVPNEDLIVGKSNVVDAGAVHVFYGRRGALSATGNQVWDQDKPGVLGVIETGDRFGDALAIANFNADRYEDLAIGVPYEDLLTGRRTNIVDAGVVHVLYGRRGALSSSGNVVWDQNKPGILGVIEAYDRFGYTLAAGDINGDRIADLAVGVPMEDLVTAQGNIVDAGAVHTINGSSFGLNAINNKVWNQDVDGVAGIVEAHDRFGFALTMGDFSGDKVADLAVGVPSEDLSVGTASYANAGFVQVLYGSRRGQVFIEGLAWNPVTGEGELSELAADAGATFDGDGDNGDGGAETLTIAVAEIEAGDPLVSSEDADRAGDPDHTLSEMDAAVDTPRADYGEIIELELETALGAEHMATATN